MPPDLDAAAQFLAAHARVLDRRRFEHLFEGGAAEPVRDAVAAYRTPDGGFGYALEPDGRGPGGQPPAVALALRTLHEADAWDEALVDDALTWLAAHAPAEGGATFVDPGVAGWPAAPWWVPEEGLPANPILTGPIAAVLLARGVEHPWLTRATEWLWTCAEGLDDPHPYEVRGVLAFLQEAPDPERVAATVDRIGELLVERDLVAFDPAAEGEVHRPLDYAPLPDSVARRLFDDDVIAAHLDHFAAAQREDGGWMFDWLAWSPVAEAEWRGSVTVDALVLLRANHRL